MTIRKPVYLPPYVKPRHWLVSAFIWVGEFLAISLFMTSLFWGLYLLDAAGVISGR